MEAVGRAVQLRRIDSTSPGSRRADRRSCTGRIGCTDPASHTGTASAMLRFSQMRSAGRPRAVHRQRLTGISSPRPASIRAVTSRTKAGACCRHERRAAPSVLVAASGTVTSNSRASVSSTAGKFAAPRPHPCCRRSSADRLLDLRDRLLARQHAGDGEEAGLQHGVGAAAQPDVRRHAWRHR